jgi:hypothetical protein
MNEAKKYIVAMQADVSRLNSARLPRALQLKSKVKRGERLEYHDVAFLKHALDDANGLKAVVARNPEYRALVTRLIALYADIMSKGLENENNT